MGHDQNLCLFFFLYDFALLLIIVTLMEIKLTCNDSHGQTYSDRDEESTNVKYSKPDCSVNEGHRLSHLCVHMCSPMLII